MIFNYQLIVAGERSNCCGGYMFCHGFPPPGRVGITRFKVHLPISYLLMSFYQE